MGDTSESRESRVCGGLMMCVEARGDYRCVPVGYTWDLGLCGDQRQTRGLSSRLVRDTVW